MHKVGHLAVEEPCVQPQGRLQNNILNLGYPDKVGETDYATRRPLRHSPATRGGVRATRRGGHARAEAPILFVHGLGACRREVE